MKPLKTYFLFLGVVFLAFGTLGVGQQSENEDWTKAVSSMPAEPANESQRALRHARNSRFDDTTGKKTRLDLAQDADDTRGSGMSVLYKRIPPLPAQQSEAVLIGTVTSSQAYFSADRTAIYSELRIEVERVFSDRIQTVGSTITTLALGGAIRLPDGRIARQFVPPMQNRLYVGRRYVLFLNYFAATQSFSVVKAWELRNGTTVPLSDSDITDAKSGKSKYAGMTESAFLDAVKDAVSSISQ